MESEKRNNDDFKPEIGRGCAFCDSGDEVEARPCDGCFKLHETAWQEGYPDNIPTDLFEVRFKNTRRSFYQNVNNLDLKRGDIVAVEASPGHDIGIVSLTGDMVARQIRRLGFTPYNGEYRKIYRKAKPYDIERWQEAIALEHETMIAARQIAADMGLNMKIGDVEYQGDKIKAIFYYIADERVDFRELIKVFAERFRIRIEMKQIGARQEAGRIGGLGACGRELCCASWMSTFTSVTTGAARVQEISLNPQKLAGQCSKLKCCMMYEYDAYVDARKEFPRLREPLQTIEGEWFLVKNDILSGTMTFSSSKEAMVNVTTLPVGRVKEILAMNRAGKKADQLVDEADMPPAVEEPNYGSESVEDSITRFDKARRRKRSGRSGRGGERRAEHRTGDAPKERAEEATRRDGDSPKEEGRTRREGGERPQNRRGGRNRQGGANRGEGAPDREQQPREGRPARDGQPRENRENRENREPREGKVPREGAEQRQPREPREPRDNKAPRESGGRGRSESRNRRRGAAPKSGGEERPARETPGDNETR
ncbi:regulatory iron-sulfur-containing complex subunit RicT [uncultured Alistipes sp.]|uniref:regulatory iron-sulfur-containing complex subunit RicT n=1 Tax=uncultured Alistipes sp. TaxID=538949 RepID=UPI002633DFBC|nr:regulatory iron-sulfur-containing complex subunit RicT [uncultured Alistipes sp.]